MPVDKKNVEQLITSLLVGRAAAPDLELENYLDAVPRLDALADVKSGTAVIVRGDVDAKPGAKIGDGDIRIQSMRDTLQAGIERGWKQIIFGHIGREKEKSLDKVAKRLGDILERDVPLIGDWLDETAMTVPAAARQRIAAAKPGDVLMLENTRRYDIERVLWKAKPADAATLAGPLAKFAGELADKVARVYVNEAFSAGSLDASTTIIPIAMDRVALGKYVAGEFDGPMRRCLKAQLVVFSGLKIDKLDDLEAMIGRGTIRMVIAAGSLSMALKKAIGELEGSNVCLGVAEDPAHADKPYYIPRERIEQAKQMVAEGRRKGIEFVVPVDSVLADGSVADDLQPGQQQFDVGPKTSRLFEQKVQEFIAQKPADPVAFHNGVFGMFEDPRFEAGTKNFLPQLKRLKDAGVEVYIGGGEGGLALEKYGQPDWVTHVFTAGGTVLNALGREPVPYLAALRAAAQRAT